MNKHGAKSEMQEGFCANSPIQIVTCEHYKTHLSQLLGCFWQGERGSLAAPAQQEQALQGSRSRVTLDAHCWPGTSSFSLHCNAVWLQGALWIPGDAHLLLDSLGGCGQGAHMGVCAGGGWPVLVPRSLQGFTHTGWDKLSLVPQRCSHPPFLGCHVSVT